MRLARRPAGRALRASQPGRHQQLRARAAAAGPHQEQQQQQQVGWQGASDFLIRNERLAARGLHTYHFSLDYLEEGCSGEAPGFRGRPGEPPHARAAPTCARAV